MGVNPKLLRRSPLFAELPATDVNAVAEMAGMRWFDRGDYLYRQGQVAERFFVVFDGAVKISRVTEGGKSMVIDFRGPGSVVGGRAIVAEKAHADDASAVEDVLVAGIPLTAAAELLGSRPGAALSLARHLALRLAEREAKVAALSTKRVHQRLAEALLELAGSLGAAVDDVIVINARLTQAELAEWIGTTRETTSTLLNGLRRAGFIDIESRRIHVRDRAALEACASVEDLPEDLGELVATMRPDERPALARSA
jgi:CRP/FNR family transcriptional regulator